MMSMTFLAVTLGSMLSATDAAPAFRPPAVPLVTHDPYFSVWSFDDKLTDSWSRHWTGKVNALCGLVRIDGKPYRFAGASPADVPAMEQRTLTVNATSTVYDFAGGGISLQVTFLSPLLPDDIDLLSRPATYVTITALSMDAADHTVQVYLDITGEWCVNKPEQEVQWGRLDFAGGTAVLMGSVQQPVLAKKGDDLRIDWGHVYMALPKQEGVTSRIGLADESRGAFVKKGKLRAKDIEGSRKVNDEWPVLASLLDFGKAGKEPVMRQVILAYDDEYSIEFMGTKLRPYWRRGGMDATGMLAAAVKDYPALKERCAQFDAELAQKLDAAGGAEYAQMCLLAYREAIAAQKIAAGADGEPLMFPKENFSNGCISTVDVIYPASPVFLLLNTRLEAAQLKPVMDYAASGRWPWPFAPHDVGTYPLANGQVYGGGEKTEKNQMPVEESANMILIMGAMAKKDGNADFANKYWPTVVKWAEYLAEKGLDPENQLCTDDFAGHLAHNVNLSAKAILALGAFSQLCDATQRPDDAKKYLGMAKEMAEKWVQMADDGDHYRLAFDKPGTWSQKYNLVWDKLLGLNLFPADVARREIAYYLKSLNTYGMPLDNRKDYTKLDWIVWSATLAEKKEDFQALIAPAFKFLNETPSRVPITDWYDTKTAKMVGFQARPVIGGLFIKAMQ
jgi:hypothetical protein